MATHYEKLGVRIRKFRKEAGLTQEELAEKAKMDPKSIIQIEAGKRNPTFKTLQKIAKSLGIPLPNLID